MDERGDDVPRARSRSAFLEAAMSRPAPHTPVWFMRQAGRSLPEYRAIRGEGSILDAIKRPETAAEITLQPVRRYGVDAAVLYSDIIVPAHAVGFGVDVAPGTGPVAERPLRSRADLARLRPLEPDDIGYVTDTVGPGARGAGARRAGARLRRGPVHRRQLPRGGCAEPGLPPHQGADAPRRGAVARGARRPGDARRGVRALAARRRRRGLPDLRLVGRRTVGGGLRAFRAPPLSSRVRRPRRVPPGRAGDPLRHRLRPPARVDGGGRSDR